MTFAFHCDKAAPSHAWILGKGHIKKTVTVLVNCGASLVGGFFQRVVDFLPFPSSIILIMYRNGIRSGGSYSLRREVSSETTTGSPGVMFLFFPSIESADELKIKAQLIDMVDRTANSRFLDFVLNRLIEHPPF